MNCGPSALRLAFAARIANPTLGVHCSEYLVSLRISDDKGTRSFSCGRPDFIAPSSPSRPRAAGKQLDLRHFRVHALDKLVGFIGLAAVLSAPRFDYRAGSFCWLGGLETRHVGR